MNFNSAQVQNFGAILGSPVVDAQTKVGQFMDANEAHREWASRPSDERYQSVESLHNAALARDVRAVSKIIPATTLEVAPMGEELALAGKGGALVKLTNYSFGQIAAHAKAPASFISTLTPSTAALVLNEKLAKSERQGHQVYVGRDTPSNPSQFTLRSLNSPAYARVKHSDITQRLLAIMGNHPEWKLPMGYKNGQWGAELVPSGAYLGDRDMFVMLIDGNRSLDAPASDGGLFRGIMIRNSDVGYATLTMTMFLFERVCGNNIIWGFQHIVGFRRRHVGDQRAIQAGFMGQLRKATEALNASAFGQQALIHKANTIELGKDVNEITLKVKAIVPSATTVHDAYDLAEKFNQNPRSAWGFAHGLTRLSQVDNSYADARYDLDKAAGELLSKFVKE
jgi:hypothetical protein